MASAALHQWFFATGTFQSRHSLGTRPRHRSRHGKDIRLGGGVATIRQYLCEGLIDEMHLAIAPVLLGAGEHLFRDIDAAKLGYHCTQHAPAANAPHVILTKRPQRSQTLQEF